jgi:HEAT repeat protein
MRSLVIAVCLSVLLVSVPGDVRGQDGGESPKAAARRLITRFREIDKSPDWEKIKERRDILVALGDVDHSAVPPVLLEAFAKDREQLCRIQAEIALGKRGSFGSLKRMIGMARRERNDVFLMALPLSIRHTKDEKIGAWMAGKLLGPRKPETLRPTALECLGLLRETSAKEAVEKILAKDRGVRVRYEALIALARIAGTDAGKTVESFLDDDDAIVRQGAVEAMGEIPGATATRRLLEALKKDEPRVKEAAANALAARKCEDALEAIMEELAPHNSLRVRDAMRRALKELTGQDHGFDGDAWRAWLKRRESGKEDPGEDPKTKSVPTYWTLPVFSDRVLFILDISGSMDAGDPKRIETARHELTKTLKRLDRRTIFNVIAFGSDPRPWERQEVPATKENVARAVEWVDKISVGGGTNVYDTFEDALESNRLVDTIYFLGDGSPSLGKYTEQEEILVRIRWMNRFRKVRIHTIALLRGEVPRFGGRNSPMAQGRGRSISGPRYFDKDEAARFLRELAERNDGSFIEIRK